jgi:hypothetical protein
MTTVGAGFPRPGDSNPDLLKGKRPLGGAQMAT